MGNYRQQNWTELGCITLFIGIFNLIGSAGFASYTGYTIYAIANGENFYEQYNLTYGQALLICGIVIGLSMVNGIMAIILLMGVIQKRTRFLTAWIYYIIFHLILNVIIFLSSFRYPHVTEHLLPNLLSIVFLGVFIKTTFAHREELRFINSAMRHEDQDQIPIPGYIGTNL